MLAAAIATPAGTAWDTLASIDRLGRHDLVQRAITLIGIQQDAAPSDVHTITDGLSGQTASVHRLPDDQTLALPGPSATTRFPTPSRRPWTPSPPDCSPCHRPRHHRPVRDTGPSQGV